MKHLSLIVALMLVSIVGFAQENNSSKGLGGFAIRAGYNNSIVYGPTIHFEWQSGFNIGGSADYSFSETFCVRFGLCYIKKGFYADDGLWENPFHYIEMPILAVLRNNVNSKLCLEIQAGSYLAYGVGGKTKYNGFKAPVIKWTDPETGATMDNSVEGKIFDMFDRFDWGFNIGLGANISHIYIGVSFEMGMSEIMSNAQHYCALGSMGYRF